MTEFSESERPQAPSRPPARVLFVDDIPELREQMVTTLKRAGIEATAIGRPSEALPQIIRGDYQLGSVPKLPFQEIS